MALPALVPLVPALAARAADEPVAVRIDGRFDDWPGTTHLQADDRYLYVRLVLPEERNLQASAQPLRLAIDLGASGAFSPDLHVVFSPHATGGQGVAVEAVAPGRFEAIGHAAVDLVAAPTVAARAFELRVARDVRGRPDLTSAFAGGAVRVQASLLRADGSPAWRDRARQLELPPRARPGPGETPTAAGAPPSSAPTATDVTAAIPARAPDTLRVVSWNVLLASPRKRPAPFARVLRALAPDVVLLQEWEGATDAELAAWFDTHLPGDAAWRALTSDGWGVAVVARAPLAPLVPRSLPRPAGAPEDARRADAALRLAAGVADTRLGRVCAASVHLKCCGAWDAPQDLARRAEARAVNDALRAALAGAAPCLRVVGGDLNLVGSALPLDLLADGLDAAGGPLVAVESPVVGDAALYTWFHPWSRFSPGRLDYLLYDGSSAAVRSSLALDARRLAAGTLAALGIEPGDAAASDHLPLVLDLALRMETPDPPASLDGR